MNGDKPQKMGDRSCEPVQNVVYISTASFLYFLSTKHRLLSFATRQAYFSFQLINRVLRVVVKLIKLSPSSQQSVLLELKV